VQDITNLNRQELPSNSSLFKATGIALLIAALALFTIILPAEYGIDPTGLGKKMGLTLLSSEDVTEPVSLDVAPAAKENLLAVSASPVWKSSKELKSDTTKITLSPNEGLEVKAAMSAGDHLIFSWIADGPVSFDMHGERLNDGDNFTSYWQGRNELTASGDFEAPFDGTHGWYWRNRGNTSVTVTLKTSGFYSKIFKQ
tara:strand:- start:37 stop:633 length:597 start_codon:yes stop_codon:yes gene_type:complete